MKILGMALLMTFGTAFASANSYDLKMDLSINGKHISSPKIIVEEGKVATVTQKNDNGEELFVVVIATKKELKNNKEAVAIKFTSGMLDKNGKRSIQYETKIIALENQMAKINQGSVNGKDELALSIVATKKVQ
jgi:hypothetical protein